MLWLETTEPSSAVIANWGAGSPSLGRLTPESYLTPSPRSRSAPGAAREAGGGSPGRRPARQRPGLQPHRDRDPRPAPGAGPAEARLPVTPPAAWTRRGR